MTDPPPSPRDTNLSVDPRGGELRRSRPSSGPPTTPRYFYYRYTYACVCYTRRSSADRIVCPLVRLNVDAIKYRAIRGRPRAEESGNTRRKRYAGIKIAFATFRKSKLAPCFSIIGARLHLAASASRRKCISPGALRKALFNVASWDDGLHGE